MVLLEPRNGPARLVVVVALLFGQYFVECGVDQLERRADAHGGAVRLQDRVVARVDRHARANRGLGEVYRRDVGALERPQRIR
ncbi:hypothetical protein CJ255_05390 [Candidatus Viridilinea mediisalina]|uniref:Uncharacterized protein n=1 Tax=Candidatus Viridilinea mediisalina TaxID=2024553 RepID=A0A2A6RMI0_9CHLR|nr:hypothetical protein CJ255_05390 [Candidatus Viridilinea mediisalina]